MKTVILLSSLLLSASVNAALEPLNNTDLQQVEGQAGADISLNLSLNQSSPGVFDTTLCSDLKFCRLGIALNNRSTTDGKKLWLVFKGIQGTINIQQVALDGVDLIYGSTVKPAIQLSFNPLKPIQFRNVGFNSVSIETDTVANEGAGNIPGYLATGTYTTAGFDANREKGFTGLMINGNLSVAGTIKIFSCDSSHPRC
ncbi:DUF6160 family protein [Alkanindiges illinoisensis]|uniref:DUF6160 family protein n=1 Tax=Alkanindiges illinoisensis TaxID=197183 RepID=UPI00047AD53F|nr:DUF6160 family protein [Alkanindiges illinoisensis]